MRSLLDGYHAAFRNHRLGCEVEALLCYYQGSLLGGYFTFLLDRLVADCYRPPERVVAAYGPAFTAYLNTSFLVPVPPKGPILSRVWPKKADCRKTFLEVVFKSRLKRPLDGRMSYKRMIYSFVLNGKV